MVFAGPAPQEAAAETGAERLVRCHDNQPRVAESLKMAADPLYPA